MKNKTKHFIALFILVAVYCLNVFPGIINSFTAFTYDNGRDMLVTYRLLFERDFTLIGPTTGIRGVFHGAWWYYLLTIPFLLFRGNPTGVAFFIALIGLVGLFVLYYLILRIFNFTTAFLTGLLYSTSPEIIGRFSQIGHNNLEVPVGILTYVFLYHYLNSQNSFKKTIFFGLFGMFSAFIFEFEFAYGLFILIFNIIFAILLVERKNIKQLLIFGIGILIPLIPRSLFEIRHSFLMTQNLINYFLHSTSGTIYQGKIVDRFFNRIDVFGSFWNGLFLDQSGIMSAIILSVVMFFIIRVLLKKQKLEKTVKTLFIFAVLSPAFLFLCFLYYKDVIWGNYLNGMMIYLLFIIACTTWGLSKLHKNFPAAIWLFAGIVIILNFQNFSKKINRPWKGDYSVMKNQSDIMRLIDKDTAGKRTYALGVYTASGYSYYYDYYYLRQEKFFNLPRPKSLWKEKINYIIIEPDSRKILLTNWRQKNIDKKAKLIKKWQVVDVQIEKWTL